MTEATRLAEIYNRLNDLILDESVDAADFSRPTRGYYNIALIAAYKRGFCDAQLDRIRELEAK